MNFIAKPLTSPASAPAAPSSLAKRKPTRQSTRRNFTALWLGENAPLPRSLEPNKKTAPSGAVSNVVVATIDGDQDLVRGQAGGVFLDGFGDFDRLRGRLLPHDRLRL